MAGEPDPRAKTKMKENRKAAAAAELARRAAAGTEGQPADATPAGAAEATDENGGLAELEAVLAESAGEATETEEEVGTASAVETDTHSVDEPTLADVVAVCDDLVGRVETAEAANAALRAEVAKLSDFRSKTTEVIVATCEQVAGEVIGGFLSREWKPKMEEILATVTAVKKEKATSDTELAELRLHLPLLRRHEGLNARIAAAEKAAERAEKAAAVITAAVAKLKPAATPATQAAVPTPTAGEDDPLSVR